MLSRISDIGLRLLTVDTKSSPTAEKQRVSCPHGGGRPSSPLPSDTYAYLRIRNPQH